MKRQIDIPELTKNEFERFIANGISVIDFYADWYMPCLMLAPIFEESAEKFRKKVRFARVNVDDNNELAEKFKVISIPTIIFIKEGKEIHRITGMMQTEDLENALRHIQGADK
jgi:thioredoxin 1